MRIPVFKKICLLCRHLILWRFIPLIYHYRKHRQLIKILSSPQVNLLLHRHPQLAYKYLGGNYLARGLSTKERLEILANHYGFLRNYVVEDFFIQIFERKHVLWLENKEGYSFSISLSFPHSLHHPGRTVDHEGDLALIFEINSQPAYVYCFTITPTSVMHKKEESTQYNAEFSNEQALFIGRIQGIAGDFDLMKKTTKLLHDISPSHLLLNATRAIAFAFNINTIYGVSTHAQLSNTPKAGVRELFFDYDYFWLSLEAEKANHNMFSLPVRDFEKPIGLIKQKHRSRTLEKRRFKEQLRHQVMNTFQKNLLLPR